MKTRCKPLATALAATLQLAAIAAVPLAWDVRPGQPAPVMFDRYHGETLSFSATFRGFGDRPFAEGADIRLWYQTNGMGAAWWSTPATIRSNVLTATWSPDLDPGAERVSLFFGAPSNVYAAAALRLRHSPGFLPGAMPEPEAFRESDPVFSAWLSTYTPPDISLAPATNYTDEVARDFETGKRMALVASVLTGEYDVTASDVIEWLGAKQDALPYPTNAIPYAAISGAPAITPPGDYATVSNRAMSARSKADLVVYAAETTPWTCSSVSASGWYAESTNLSHWSFATWNQDGMVYPTIWYDGVEIGDCNSPISEEDLPAATEWNMDFQDLDGAIFVQFVRKVAMQPTKDRLATTSDIPAAPDLSPIQQDIADLRTESALVYRLYSGSNVVAEVTNYNSQVHAPELRLMQLNESNEYITVWTETNGLARTLAKANEYTDAAITNRAAPRAWSKVTAGMGVEAPSNTTWLSTARTVIAGGLEYEKHVTSGGAIWLLESNGMTPDFHPQTNNTAFLDLANADGTPIFRVEKTDSFLVGVHIDAVTVDGNALVCSVGVVAAEHPLVRVRASLSSGEWIREEDGIPASLATVTWSGSTGNWTCRIANNTGGGQLFAQMEYLQDGGTKIVNSAPMSVSQGILCTDGIHKCRPVYSNGSITWEVVP